MFASRRVVMLAAAALFAATAARAAEREPVPAAPESYNSSASGWTLSGDAAPGLAIGDPAPTFSYLGVDGDWHESQDLVSRGAVLLVFGARDPQLHELDAARARFAALGVRTVAVLDMRTGSAARLVRRLKYASSTMVDPQCAIAELFSSLDPITRHHEAACFVIDERGRMRGAVRGHIPAAASLVDFATRSLGRPVPAASTAGAE